MLRIEHDDQAAERIASQRGLPSVDDWIAAGGEVQYPSEPPRFDAVMVTHVKRTGETG